MDSSECSGPIPLNKDLPQIKKIYICFEKVGHVACGGD
jgi:hypothetical protein